MGLTPEDTIPVDSSSSDQEPISCEFEDLTQPSKDTIPCPPPDWDELDPE